MAVLAVKLQHHSGHKHLHNHTDCCWMHALTSEIRGLVWLTRGNCYAEDEFIREQKGKDRDRMHSQSSLLWQRTRTCPCICAFQGLCHIHGRLSRGPPVQDPLCQEGWWQGWWRGLCHRCQHCNPSMLDPRAWGHAGGAQEGSVWEGVSGRLGNAQNLGGKGGLTYLNSHKKHKFLVVSCMYC